ncbi:hypothetical protein BC670_1923 [Flavobacterium branchiophilum]|uniref:Uncharacterized protein n=1 Tax=Flavobacterium branchiophilum TaxID=55197 RepID=A0A543G4G5_9FLAO|nr:hypothetical protein BC670_1923 [Flavobacterium branchiophilum]
MALENGFEPIVCYSKPHFEKKDVLYSIVKW